MANAWRSYRPIDVGGRRYRWAVSFNHPAERCSLAFVQRGASWPPDRLLVRVEDEPSRLLTVSWPACSGPVVTPGLVRACVEEAMRQGWPERVTSLDLAGTGVET